MHNRKVTFSEFYGFPKYPIGFEGERYTSFNIASLIRDPNIPLSSPVINHTEHSNSEYNNPRGRFSTNSSSLPNGYSNSRATYNDEIPDAPADHIVKNQLENMYQTENVLFRRNQNDMIFEVEGLENFHQLNLKPELLNGIYAKMGFDRPSKIQAHTLPLLTQPPYPSIIAQAQNGSGKTTCFTVCILTRLDFNFHLPQALIVVPTRELVIQIEHVIRTIGHYTTVTTLSTSQSDEVHARQAIIQEMVIIGTPGSLQIWRQRQWLRFDFLVIVVFDEADQMIAIKGFAAESYKMLMEIDRDTGKHGPKPQILLFSATFNDDVKDFAHKLFKRFPRDVTYKIWLDKGELSLSNIKQANINCDGFWGKFSVLKDVIFKTCEKLEKTIIFVRLRSTARKLHDLLTTDGFMVTAISGEMDYRDRDYVISDFRNSVTTILISTDLLARGFDVLEVALVVNFDIPFIMNENEPDYETYLHRSGRSGRFKRKGAVFNLIDTTDAYGRDRYYMQKIADFYEREIPDLDVTNEASVIEFLRNAGLTE